MESKLKDYGNKIVCMDGTHCTNKRGLDLTIMLVKDDRNAGFPVAFFLTNRLDQIAQEIFLDALRNKINCDINPLYFMTDDDPKYYNSWIKIMNNKPRRLLCTWHVVKNWNFQGKSKIQNKEVKKLMKTDLKRILNETKVERFLHLKNDYFNKLQSAGEDKFLSYLKNYYFQSEERIHMWAHCFRTYAGINTNMALESLNNLLKTNQIKRKTNITVEKLLDKLEDLVDAKMWQRILDIKRPNSNNYQDQITIKAHKQAEKMNRNCIKEIGFGQFQVQSTNSTYSISYNELCEKECKTLYCRVCKICIHRYKCDCPQYTVKTTICKHIHLICLYERGGGCNSVLANVTNVLQDNSEIKEHHKQEIQEFIEEKKTGTEEFHENNEDTVRRLRTQEVVNFLNDLDFKTFNSTVHNILKMKEVTQQARKRKMEVQNYFPSKKK